MKIKIIAVGKIKEASLKILINEYLKQLNNISIIEVKDEKNKDGMKLEATKILKNIDENEFVVALLIEGKMLDSISFSKEIEFIYNTYNKPITFVIGGSYGLDESVIKRSNYNLSLSKMTFPHQLTRLILVEQIYRAMMILKKHPYHK